MGHGEPLPCLGRCVPKGSCVIARGGSLHFVDDRYETLAAVAASPLLGPAVAARALRLHFAGWGYAAAEEKKAALDDSSVTCLTLEAFTELLRWGLVMGVDDGCEPSREEVARGVGAVGGVGCSGSHAAAALVATALAPIPASLASTRPAAPCTSSTTHS